MEKRCRADGFAGKPLIFLLLRLVCLMHASCEFTRSLFTRHKPCLQDLEALGRHPGRTGVQGTCLHPWVAGRGPTKDTTLGTSPRDEVVRWGLCCWPASEQQTVSAETGSELPWQSCLCLCK